jgi:hypothetical protein
MKETGKLVAPVADWQTKRRWVKEAFAALESAGYTVKSGYTAVLNPSRTKFVYRDELWSGADLLGLGAENLRFVPAPSQARCLRGSKKRHMKSIEGGEPHRCRPLATRSRGAAIWPRLSRLLPFPRSVTKRPTS